jgi:hypothetical protein
LVGKPEGKRLLEDLDIDGTIIVKLTLKKISWIAFIWLMMGLSGGLL